MHIKEKLINVYQRGKGQSASWLMICSINAISSWKRLRWSSSGSICSRHCLKRLNEGLRCASSKFVEPTLSATVGNGYDLTIFSLDCVSFQKSMGFQIPDIPLSSLETDHVNLRKQNFRGQFNKYRCHVVTVIATNLRNNSIALIMPMRDVDSDKMWNRVAAKHCL